MALRTFNTGRTGNAPPASDAVRNGTGRRPNNSLSIEKPSETEPRRSHHPMVRDRREILQDALRGEISSLNERNVSLAANVKEKNLRLEGAERARSALLANLSHELRTPLNAILGFSEALLIEPFGPLGDAKYVEYVDDIRTSGHLLLSQIEELLDVAQIESGEASLDRENVDLVQLLCAARQDAAVALSAREIELRIGVFLPKRLVYADKRRLGKALSYIVLDRVRRSDRGTVLSVRAEIVGDMIEISVMDTGSNAPKPAPSSKQSARPEAGYDLDPFAGQSSLCFGLVTARSIAELHGGDLIVSNDRPRGRSIRLSLPAMLLRDEN